MNHSKLVMNHNKLAFNASEVQQELQKYGCTKSEISRAMMNYAPIVINYIFLITYFNTYITNNNANKTYIPVTRISLYFRRYK